MFCGFQHIDAYLAYVRKRQWESPQLPQRCTTTDTVFATWLRGEWDHAKAMPQSHQWGQLLTQAIDGHLSEHFFYRWSQVDTVSTYLICRGNFVHRPYITSLHMYGEFF